MALEPYDEVFTPEQAREATDVAVASTVAAESDWLHAMRGRSWVGLGYDDRESWVRAEWAAASRQRVFQLVEHVRFAGELEEAGVPRQPVDALPERRTRSLSRGQKAETVAKAKRARSPERKARIVDEALASPPKPPVQSERQRRCGACGRSCDCERTATHRVIDLPTGRSAPKVRRPVKRTGPRRDADQPAPGEKCRHPLTRRLGDGCGVCGAKVKGA